MIPPTLLRHTCTFEQRVEGTRSGTGQVNYTYITAQSGVRCRLDDAGGREYHASSGKYVKADYILFVNCKSVQVALSEKDFRVVVDSKYYNILFISDAGGAGHHYEIALERIY